MQISITNHAEERALERYSFSLRYFRKSLIEQLTSKTAKPVGYKDHYMVVINGKVLTLVVKRNPLRVITVLDTAEYASTWAGK